MEIVYLSNFMLDLSFKSFGTVPVNCDSTGALSVAGNPTQSTWTKHIALRFFLRELVKSGKTAIHLIPTRTMLADIGTKHLPNSAFRSILDLSRSADVL